MNGYELSRDWWDFCFENPEKITPSHSAIYFFAIEHCNRLGWKLKFGFPTSMAMDAIGIKKHETYIKYFYDLCEWGFFILVQKSTNQYSSNIISLSNGITKNGKALEKAILKQQRKQLESNVESNGSIDKPITYNQEPITNSFPKKRKKLTIEEYVKQNKETLSEIFTEFPTIKKSANLWLEYKFKKKGYKETKWANVMVERIKSTSIAFIEKRIIETIAGETYEDYFYSNHQIEFDKQNKPQGKELTFTPAPPKKQMTNEERRRA